MDDETRLSEADERVRAALSADSEATQRVLAAALGDRSQRFARRRYALAAAVAVVFPLGAAMWLWPVRRTPGTEPLPSVTTSLKLTGHGQLIVVESQDGRRWIVGPPPPPRTGGSYVIVVPQ
jgi:hypothetical protein